MLACLLELLPRLLNRACLSQPAWGVVFHTEYRYGDSGKKSSIFHSSSESSARTLFQALFSGALGTVSIDRDRSHSFRPLHTFH